jgi:hypothetical protein
MDTKTAVLFAAFAAPAPDFSAFDAPPAAAATTGVVSGPTVSPDGYYELRQAWDGSRWNQIWVRKDVSQPANPFYRAPVATIPTTFVPFQGAGVTNTSRAVAAPSQEVIYTLVPRDIRGGTSTSSGCPPSG